MTPSFAALRRSTVIRVLIKHRVVSATIMHWDIMYKLSFKSDPRGFGYL